MCAFRTAAALRHGRKQGRGDDIRVRSQGSRTAFLCCCLTRSLFVAVNVVHHGHGQLFALIASRDVEEVRKLLSEQPAAGDVNELLPKSSGSSYSRAAIFAAATESSGDEKAQCEIVSLLLNARAKADLASTHNETALHAVNSLAITKLLLGADPAPDVNIKGLMERSPLHRQALLGSGPGCQLLIDAKANVDAVDCEGNTALIQALIVSEPSPVSVLLAAKANVFIKNEAGKSAQTVAPSSSLLTSTKKRTEECKRLISAHIASAGVTPKP